jgi:hypothetical protein
MVEEYGIPHSLFATSHTHPRPPFDGCAVMAFQGVIRTRQDPLSRGPLTVRMQAPDWVPAMGSDQPPEQNVRQGGVSANSTTNVGYRDMVGTYNSHGVKFLFPDNWALSEERPDARNHCITLQSPGSGFWMLQLLQTTQSPAQLAAEALRSVKQEYEDLEFSPATEEIDGTETVGYDLQFYCLDFVVSARVRSFAIQDKIGVLLVQAEDGEFEQMSLVFLAITTSLLAESKKTESHSVESQ